MTPEEYWNKLESEIKKFDEKKIAPSNDKDGEEYEMQKITLLKIASIAHEAHKCWFPLEKTKCLQEAEALIKEKFGAEGLPTIVGKKTRNFIESVYIPHLQDRKNIDFGLQGTVFNAVLKLAGSNDTLNDRVLKAKIKAEILTERIKDYDTMQEALPLQKQSLFAQSSKVDAKEAKKEEIKSPSP